MKKAAVLFMASFYLLVTTGTFVCLIHCAASQFITPKTGMQMSGAENIAPMKHCKDKEDCNCCKKHGVFVIKENLKPEYHFGFDSSISFNAVCFLNLSLFPPRFTVSSYTLVTDSSPPGRSGKEISIKLHSLQV